MGRMIYDSGIYMQTINLFAWTIAVLVVSVFMVKDEPFTVLDDATRRRIYHCIFEEAKKDKS